jgi:hypothetical protein
MNAPVPPNPTWLYRIIHIANLPQLLGRGALHAPNFTPNDGLIYRPIHSVAVQANRHQKIIPCGPGGTIHDYLPFYFGPWSVMLFNLKTGRVDDYNEGQEPLIYLATSAQKIQQNQYSFVFSDGHGLANYTNWYDDLAHLDNVGWNVVNAKYWKNTWEDNDRQRRKQAEFLVWQSLQWSMIAGIGVLNANMAQRVQQILSTFQHRNAPQVAIRPDLYY